jgi:hypothetical protein
MCIEIFRFQNRIELSSSRNLLLGDPRALMSEQNGHPLDWYAGK